MLKKLLVLLGVGTAVVALAAVLVQGAKGQGVAQSAAGIRGEFRFDVKKVTDGNRTEVGGGFNWNSHNPAAHRGVEIHMPRAHRFAKEGNVAEFDGPARAMFRIGNRRVNVEGALHVRVRDSRNREHPTGERDWIELRFTHANPNHPPYGFDGNVVHGDIAVYQHERP